MTELEQPRERTIEHLSHSQVSSFARCGEAYRLRYMGGMREHPAYWSVGGTAIHAAIEYYERLRFDGKTASRDELVGIFEDALERRYREDAAKFLDDRGAIDPTVWRAGGRKSNEWPNKEDLSWWRINGAKQVEEFLDWRSLQPYEIYEMPDGEPCIEIPFRVVFPETEYYRAVVVVGYIDAGIIFNTGVFGVRDYKSGSRKPDSTSQLGLYAYALETTINVRPSFGDYLLTRKMETTEPDLLTEWTPERLHAGYDAVLRAREAGAFVPNPGQACVTCGVKRGCRLKGDPADVERFKHAGLVVTRNYDSEGSTELSSEEG